MRSFSLPALLFSCAMLLASVPGCPAGEAPQPDDHGRGGESLGRYMFDAPEPFTDVGTLDTPRLVMPHRGEVHLVYLLHDGSSQRIMYSRLEGGEFRPATYLSQREGRKTGGGFLAARSADDLVTYWINVTAAGGQLYYKSSDDGGRTFTLEARWNDRGEARWPCVLPIGNEMVAYFFARSGDDWELLAHRGFGGGDEPTIDVAQGNPFHLQGVTDGSQRVRFAYFVRRPNADGGRIAFLTSEDGGKQFIRRYLFEDRVIPNLTSFFSLARTQHPDGRVKETLHLVFTEESPDLTTIYYSRSEDGGATFTTPVAMISSEDPLTSSPVLVANRQYVLIATADADDEGPALRYVFSEDMGKSFHPPAIATRSVTDPETISGVMDDNGTVLLVWDDFARVGELGEQLCKLRGTLRGK